ncbi:MAG: DUF4386 domain-containing protein [Chloroflexota bacterium]
MATNAIATNEITNSINNTSVMEGDKQMNSSRKNAAVTGVILIVATVAALAASTVEPVLIGTDYLTKASGNASQVAVGAIFFLIAAFASVGIAISLYPVLKKWNAGLALGSVVFRTMEAVMYIAAVVSLLSLVTLSQHFANAGSTNDIASFQAIGDSLRSVREHATLAAEFALSLGAFMYYYIFFQSRLVPRWLSGWGIAGSALMLAACLLALFSDSYVTGYVLLILPIAVQEMVLAVWLIVKGFNQSAIAAISSGSARMETDELLSAI